MTETLKTAAGRYYTAEVSIGEHGEAVYDVKRVGQMGAFPVGTFVIHPDYHAFPEVDGLVNIQFGGGSPTDRHQRTNVPVLGSASLPYVVGHQLVNPADLVDETSVFRLRDLAGASTGTGTSAGGATLNTSARTADLVTALVRNWQARDDYDQLTATYTATLAPQRAEAIAKKADDLSCKIMSIGERIDELTKQRDELPATTAPQSDDITPDMAPAVQLTGQILALQCKREDLIAERADLTK
ncbi:hypothetical protein AQJ46_47020 [Streptomyces canus]|uniref:Uncharacterized protein n=1 Tax=Streptomyces canus TaxID=58343 RepID=A0A101RL94_9ACTN|nr:hypothetical protein [Streptomyces canus]KUN57621.1 hypothetical protein AQJ46_47020 [Streptomyces canus]